MKAKMFATRLATHVALPVLAIAASAQAHAADFDWMKFKGKTVTFLANNNPVSQALLTYKADFEKLTRIPIVIYYGDNFPAEPTPERGQDNWRVRLAMARLWVDAVNRHGGDARLVHLPEIGIRGNTHFMMSDLNNLKIADQVSKFLKEKKLDRAAGSAGSPDRGSDIPNAR